LLAVRPSIDGIFAFNDPLAIGATEAILAAGLRIPDDIALIGCGNIPLGATLRLPLSTVDQHTKLLAEKAAKGVLGLLDKGGKSNRSKKVIVKPSLLVRQSSQRSLESSNN
jgi:LacI family transcriptional regulator